MKEYFKKQFAIDLIRFVLLAGLVPVGIGIASLWSTYKFQKDYQANILSAQRQQIEATCEQVWQQKHPAKEKEDAGKE